MKKIKILIVDDHELMRIGIKKLLSEVSDFEIVGEAETGELALPSVKELKPNIVLMDVKMPGIGGLETTRKLLRFNPELKIIIVTSCVEEPFPSKLLQAGASGYITKGCGFDEIEQAIRKVHSGQLYIIPEIAQKLAEKNLFDEKSSPFDKLSQRELQVMMMITNGEKVQTIAEKLNIAAKTINTYRYRLFEKLNIETDVELTHLALRYGMLNKEFMSDDE